MTAAPVRVPRACRACPRPPAAPALAPRACDGCGAPADDLLFDGRRHVCEPCFDGLLAGLRNLPPMTPERFDAALARLHGVAPGAG